ncbi:MAG: hypothetical protein OFPII_37800 [Osedax symbiont Rs1]|nr:MAG: hypothetical protein OFPII_37800 [Osedax symbiont Rs1]
MNDFTVEELNVLVELCARAAIKADEKLAIELQQRLKSALLERQELAELDFEDCLSCKL